MRALILSCEHATAAIPAAYRYLFAGQRRLLASHRGFDPGAVALARRLARATGAPLFCGTASRLLVDLNRSLHHPRVFSVATAGLPPHVRQAIVDGWYTPHRRAVITAIVAAGEPVLHVSCHSFTPVLAGQVRQTDVGLLYDPSRPAEVRVARLWKAALAEVEPRLRVRFNYPYRGTSDGFTTTLRKRFGVRRYAGVELEINQKHLQGRVFARWVAHAIARSLDNVRASAKKF